MSYITPKKGERLFYSVLGVSENQYDELHGAYANKKDALAEQRRLGREYSDYTALRVVVVEVHA